jgi:hypothetical protein
MTVEFPEMRLNALVGIDTLAEAPPILLPGQRDGRWPDLTNAIHWMIDDTSWDHRPPHETIGTLLEDEAEATAAAGLVELLLALIADHGDADASYFADARWPEVRRLAADLARLMRRSQPI